MNAEPDNTRTSDVMPPMRDSRALPILAKSIFRELKESGLSEEEIMGVAGELLTQVASGLRARHL